MPNTPNLAITELTPGQSSKDVTVNQALADLDNAVAGLDTLVCTAGGTITLTRAQWLVMVLKLTGSPAAGFNVVVPVGPKVYIVDNASGQTATVKTPSGTGIAIATGTVQIVRADGTNVVAVNSPSLSGAQPYDMPFFFAGLPNNGQTIRMVMVRAVTIPANFAGFQAVSRVAFTASAVFTFKQNGTAKGTVTFGASSTTGTMSTQASFALAAGDVWELDAPAVQDTTGADVTITATGTR